MRILTAISLSLQIASAPSCSCRPKARLDFNGVFKDLAGKTSLLSPDTLDVLSWDLMVHYFRRQRGMRYGPSSSRERHNDRAGSEIWTAGVGGFSA